MRWDADGPTTWAPSTYGTALADVYDRWYPARGDEEQVVDLLRRHQPPPPRAPRLLELGVGTGRLAIPLANSGWLVTGLDAAPAMLERLERKSGAAGVTVLAFEGDAAELPVDRLTGAGGDPFDVVLAAFNFVLNLPDADALECCLRGAAQVVGAGGVLVVETQLLAPDPAGPVVWIERAARRWPVRRLTLDELDDAAGRTGWMVRDRWRIG